MNNKKTNARILTCPTLLRLLAPKRVAYAVTLPCCGVEWGSLKLEEVERRSGWGMRILLHFLASGKFGVLEGKQQYRKGSLSGQTVV